MGEIVVNSGGGIYYRSSKLPNNAVSTTTGNTRFFARVVNSFLNLIVLAELNPAVVVAVASIACTCGGGGGG